MIEHPVLPRVVAYRIVGASMEPVLRDGDLACVDVSRTSPSLRDVVAIRVNGTHRIVGYWMTRDFACLGKANPAFEPVLLDALGEWEVAGTVVAVVIDPFSRPVPPPRDDRRIDDVLTLSPRAMNRLQYGGIHTISDLLRRPAWDIGMIKGLGAKTLREILAEVARAGLVLPEKRL
jgi:hypothetical protein